MRKNLLSVAIAIASGLIVLVGYFTAIPILTNVRITIVQWAVILAAIATIIGVLNLLSVHIGKVMKKDKNGTYSLILIAALLITFVYGLVQGPNHSSMQAIFRAVILPVETSLMALMAITLIYASIRLMRRRADLMAIVFIVTALIVLLGTAPLPFFEIPLLGSLIRPFIVNLPAVAGARGILLGVALGTLLTGLRVLIGTDRPYGGK